MDWNIVLRQEELSFLLWKLAFRVLEMNTTGADGKYATSSATNQMHVEE